jgi:hypothetical protein
MYPKMSLPRVFPLGSFGAAAREMDRTSFRIAKEWREYLPNNTIQDGTGGFQVFFRHPAAPVAGSGMIGMNDPNIRRPTTDKDWNYKEP